MNADAYTRLLCNRGDLTDEIRVVVPKFFFGIFTAMSERPLIDLPVPIAFRIREMKGSRRTAAACGFRLA